MVARLCRSIFGLSIPSVIPNQWGRTAAPSVRQEDMKPARRGAGPNKFLWCWASVDDRWRRFNHVADPSTTATTTTALLLLLCAILVRAATRWPPGNYYAVILLFTEDERLNLSCSMSYSLSCFFGVLEEL
jgi:hypothetical protein